MREVFLCDAARTAIGRYGGALAKVRTDDLAAVPIKALVAAQRRCRLGRRWTRSISAAPTRPARTTAMSRAWRCCWRGCPTRCRASRVNRLCASGMNAVGDAARAIRSGEIEFRIRRRRRIDDARAAGDGQGRDAVPAQRRIARHHHRLALHQSADEGAIRRRCHAGYRRECRRGIPGQAARTRTPLRCARSSAPAQASAAGYFDTEIVPVEMPGRRSGPSSSIATSIRVPPPRWRTSPS